MDLNKIVSGSILNNKQTGEDYGVYVNKLPDNRIVVFRIQDKSYPVFSKMRVHPQINKTGHINEHRFSDLKEQLLKYYRTRNITPSEDNILKPLMNEAFPLGIPLYRPNIPLTKEEVKPNLIAKLEPSRKLMLNTTDNSTVSDLNDKTVFVMSKTPKGLWVGQPSNNVENSKFNFLFYTDKDEPRFSGISRVKVDERPTDVPTRDNPDWLKCNKRFQELQEEGGISTTMNIDGKRIKVDPETNYVIFPDILHNMIYEPFQDRIKENKDLKEMEDEEEYPDYNPNKCNSNKENSKNNDITPNEEECPYADLYDLSDKPKKQMFYYEEDEEFPHQVVELENEEQDSECGIVELGDEQSGGASKSSKLKSETNIKKTSGRQSEKTKKVSKSIKTIPDIDKDEILFKEKENQLTVDYNENVVNVDTFFEDEFESEFVNYQKNTVRTTTDSKDTKSSRSSVSSISDFEEYESESEMSDYEVEEEIDFDEQEIEVVEVDQKVERVVRPEEEKVYKQAIQKNELMKALIQKYPVGLRGNDLIKRNIKKDVNRIIDYQNKCLDENGNLKTPPKSKPLTTQYMNGDFRNNHLIPIAVTKKNIFIDPKSKINESFYNEDYHTTLNYHQYLENVNYMLDSKNNQSITNHDTLVKNILRTIMPYSINQDFQKGLILNIGQNKGKNSNTDISQLNMDVMVVRYCKNPVVCNSFEAVTDEIDFQIFLGPLQRYLDKEESGYQEDEESDNKIQVVENINNYREGEELNIVGFIRLPNNVGDLLLDELNESVEKINVDLEKDEPVNTLQHPDKLVIYKLPHNSPSNQEVEEMIDSIIPTVEEILHQYSKKVEKIYYTQDIKNLLSKYGYDYYSLDIEDYSRIMSFQMKGIDNYHKLLDKVLNKVSTKVSTKKDDDKPSSEGNKHTFINDDLLKELQKLYNSTYTDFKNSVDNDINRLQWAANQIDKGMYLYYYLLYEYYRKLEPETMLDKYTQELIEAQRQLDTLNTNFKAFNYSKDIEKECKTKLGKSRVVRYPNIADLMKDNGKQVLDKEGNIILPGDLAIAKDGKEFSVFKRIEVSGQEIWIKESKTALIKLMEEERAECENVDELDLNSKCAYDVDNMECRNSQEIEDQEEIDKLNDKISIIKDDISYLKNVAKTQKDIEKSVRKLRKFLIDKKNIKERYQKYYLEKKLKEDKQILESIFVRKDCSHDAEVNLFYNMLEHLNLEEEYRIAGNILDKYLNTEKSYDLYSISSLDDENWGESKECGTRLLCKHYLLGVNQIKQGGKVDEEEIIAVYGQHFNGAVKCKICGSHLRNSDIEDLAQFAKKGDREGARLIEREIMEQSEIEEIDLLEEFSQNSDEIATFKINIYRDLLQLTRLTNKISRDDELDMINFVKGYTFEDRDNFVIKILAIHKNLDMRTAFALANKEWRKSICLDIIGRFLILLQSSEVEYLIKNPKCKSNYYGYPLINNENETSGLDIMYCLVEQLSMDPTYSFLKSKDFSKVTNLLLKRIRLLVDNEYVKNRLLAASERKSEQIDNIIEFEEHYTNNWEEYRPQMRDVGINWQPEKKLLTSEIPATTSRNISKMLMVGNQNGDFYALSLIRIINNVISNNSPENIPMLLTSIGNSCCLDKINEGVDYYKFLSKSDKQLLEYLDNINTLSQNMISLKKKDGKTWFKVAAVLSENKAYKILPLVFDIETSEIKDLYVKYIDSGDNLGGHHIYDIYGRCILSNQLKSDIERREYHQIDFKKLMTVVRRTNNIILPEELDIDFQSKEYIESQIVDLNKLKNEYLVGYINKIVELWENGTKDVIMKMWANINSQIEVEIEAIANRLTLNKNLNSSLISIMSNLGDYKNLYDDMVNKTDDLVESSYIRYKNKEDTVVKAFNYLVSSVAQLKNKKFLNTKKDTDIIQRYKFLHKFKNEHKLFKLIYKQIEHYFRASKKIVGTRNSKFLNSEQSSTISHYLFISAISSILGIFGDDVLSGSKSVIDKDGVKSSKSGKSSKSRKNKKQMKGGYYDEDGEFIVDTMEDEYDSSLQDSYDVENGYENKKEDFEFESGTESGSEDFSIDKINVDELQLGGGPKTIINIKDGKPELIDLVEPELDDIKLEEVILSGDKSNFFVSNLRDKEESYDLRKELDEKQSKNSQIINEFIIILLKNLGENDDINNQLTRDFINNKVEELEEKKRRANLRVIKKLKYDETLGDEFKLLQLQLKFKQVEYKDLANNYKDELNESGVKVIDESVREEFTDEPGNPLDIISSEIDDESNMVRQVEMEDYNAKNQKVYNDEESDIEDDALMLSMD